MGQVVKADNSANYVGNIENATIIAMDLSQNFGAAFEFTGETGLSVTKKIKTFTLGSNKSNSVVTACHWKQFHNKSRIQKGLSKLKTPKSEETPHYYLT